MLVFPGGRVCKPGSACSRSDCWGLRDKGAAATLMKDPALSGNTAFCQAVCQCQGLVVHTCSSRTWQGRLALPHNHSWASVMAIFIYSESVWGDKIVRPPALGGFLTSLHLPYGRW